MIIQITSLMIFLQILSGCGDNVDVCSPEYVNKKEQYIVSELKKIFEECNIPVEYDELGPDGSTEIFLPDAYANLVLGPATSVFSILKERGLGLQNTTNNNFALGQFINFEEWKSYIQKTLNNITEDSKIGFMDFSNIIVNVDKNKDLKLEGFSTAYREQAGRLGLRSALSFAIQEKMITESEDDPLSVNPKPIDHSSSDLSVATQEKSYNEIIILDENISNDLKLQLKDTETELQKLEKFLDFINNYKNKKISNVLDTVSALGFRGLPEKRAGFNLSSGTRRNRTRVLLPFMETPFNNLLRAPNQSIEKNGYGTRDTYIAGGPIGTTEKVLLTVCNLLFPILLKESELGYGPSANAVAVMAGPAQSPDPEALFDAVSQSIVKEGADAVAAGINPIDLKRGIDLGTISANGEEDIGRMIAKAMDRVDNEGVITVEEAKSLDTELDVVEGMQFDRGYLSPEAMVAEKPEPKPEMPAGAPGGMGGMEVSVIFK